MPSTANFTRLVVMPEIIDVPGQYVTRRGETVTVRTVGGRAARFDCVGYYSEGMTEMWHRSGRLLSGQETLNDIVRKA